ncbi:MAG: hypothetical protein GX654_15780 [Desulfatiglans sp.]|jgi:hypothetical protein|nr:hypothetical protein [Desulfatiglans sp.]
MKIYFGRMSLFICFLLVSACASMQVELPVKYDLGDKLEQVSKIQDLRIGGGKSPSFLIIDDRNESLGESIARRDTFTLSENENHWIKVDIQSLILRNGPDEFYLLVLQRPVYDLMTVDTISFISALNIIRAKKDLVHIGGHTYVIERIYKIDGKDKMLNIKSRILGG